MNSRSSSEAAWTTTTLSSRWLGHFPLLTIEAGTQGTWCGADFLYNLYNGRRMMQPSHSKVLHPTPDIGHNPDCVARVLTHPGGTRWCKDGAKSHKNWDGDVIHQRLWLHPPAIVGELKRQIKSSYCGYHEARPIFYFNFWRQKFNVCKISQWKTLIITLCQ